MKRFKGLEISVLMLVVVLLTSMLFVSCGGSSLSCSLEGIQLSTDDSGEAVFMVGENDSSDKQTEQTQAIVTALNNAIKDRPGLAEMLEADIVDDENDTGKNAVSNDYIYKGSDHFFQTLQSFADTNYPKAKRMFPEMTCEEFYYCSAVGYAIASSNTIKPATQANPFEQSGGQLSINPSFGEVMTHGFWAVYFNQLYDNGLGLVPTSTNNTSSNEEQILDTPADVEMVVKSQLMFIPYISEYKEWFEIQEDSHYQLPKIKKSRLERYVVGTEYGGNNVLTIPLFQTLKEYGLKCGKRYLADTFAEIGTTSMVYGLLMKSCDKAKIPIGHFAWMTVRFTCYYDTGTGVSIYIANASLTFATGLKLDEGIIVGYADSHNLLSLGKLELKK